MPTPPDVERWGSLFESGHTRVSNYVCREHPARPTTWRGTGCPECAEHLRQSIARRIKRRLEARRDDDA